MPRRARRSTQSLVPMADYSARWAQLRRWNRYGIAALIATLIFLFMGTRWLASWVPWHVLPVVTLGGLVVGWASVMYFVVRQHYFECPRCDKQFFWRLWWAYQIPFRRRCAHCALRLNEEGPNKSLERTRDR